MHHLRPLVSLSLALTLTVSSADGRTIVVSPSGEDTADGSADTPLKTISKAAQLAMPGDTVLVKSGVYRERVTPPRGGEPDKPITYRGEKLGTVFIRGSERWSPTWNQGEDEVHFAIPDESLFDDDVYVDAANPFRVPLASTPYGRDGQPEAERYQSGDPDLAYTCGQVIVNGEPWEQRPFLEEVKANTATWCFEAATGKIYVNFGDLPPGEQQVEISTRRRIFAPHIRGLGHIVVEGFVMEHCGNQYPTNFWNTKKWAQAGALGLRGGHHWTVRGNLIRYAGTMAMDVGSGGNDNERDPQTAPGAPLGEDNVIENNYILDNGAAGIVGNNTKRLVVRGNVVLRNNTMRFIGKKRYEHAGLKFHYISDGLIEGNYVADNPKSPGIWLDNQFSGTRVTRNLIVNNTGERGIFLEMSDYKWDTVLVDHNISIGNGIQFYVHDASGSTVIHNLFANSPPDAKYGQGCYIYQATERTKTGYHSLFNNLFVNHKDGVMLDINYPAHKGGPQRTDHNVYDVGPADRAFLINRHSDKPSPWEPGEFFELVKRDLGDQGDPQPLHDGAKVAMTLGEWQTFWSKHGQTNDQNSMTKKGINVAFDPATHEVKIDLPFDLSELGAVHHEKLVEDYSGEPLPPPANRLPGPWQSLQKGENTFNVWRGLPLLERGQLP